MLNGQSIISVGGNPDDSGEVVVHCLRATEKKNVCIYLLEKMGIIDAFGDEVVDAVINNLI